MSQDEKLAKVMSLSRAYCKRFNKPCVTSVFFDNKGNSQIRLTTNNEDSIFKTPDKAIKLLNELVSESKAMEFFRTGSIYNK